MSSAPPGPRLGFVGLGNMGAPMAANLAAAGQSLIVYDKAGTEARAPAGAEAAGGLARVAQAAETVFLSLPDGPVVRAVAEELAATQGRAVEAVVDLSTIGIAAAQEIHLVLEAAGLGYVDAPVSGGTAGAKAATLAMMCAGPKALVEGLRPALEAMAGNVVHVGETPGQGQAMKLLNNFLSATAMAATSEAIVFGLSQGLEMDTMLDILNSATGRNSATVDKFPNRIAPGKFDAGFFTSLMTKDTVLYMESVGAAGTASSIGAEVSGVWRRMDKTMPGSDFTEVFKFIRDAGG